MLSHSYWQYKMPDNRYITGGTGITNFDPKELQLYQEAIKQSGRADIWIEQSDFTGRCGNYYSLHKRHDALFKEDLSIFWKIMEQLKIEASLDYSI